MMYATETRREKKDVKVRMFMVQKNGQNGITQNLAMLDLDAATADL